MTPGQQIQRILADIPTYKAEDIAVLLPYAAALQSALYARMLALQHQTVFPETDYLLSTEQIASRLGKSPKWVREKIDELPFALPLPGKEHRFSARRFDEWIGENLAAKMVAALPPERRQHER